MTVASQSALRFPDFLCIGAQKAGTTWLDANLRRHPGIWMPWIKELQYFNDVHIPAHRAWTGRHRLEHGSKAAARVRRWAGEDELAAERIQAIWKESVSDEWYGRIFAHASPDKICGEVTPEYSLLPSEGIEHVKRLNPRMKIIFLMRDPVERCWSHLRMLARGREDFDYLAAAKSPEVLARAGYGKILARWQEQFGGQAVFSAWVGEAQQDLRGFFAALLGFLGLPWHERTVSQAGDVVFQGPVLDMPPVVREMLDAGCRDAERGAVATWRLAAPTYPT